MVNSLYSFVDVEAKNPSNLTIRDIVKNVLRSDNGACYAEMEPFLMAPGVSGSRSFDQAYAVRILLDYDRDGDGEIAKVLVSTPTLKHRNLWDILQHVLRSTGFKMKHGRLIGLLEHKPEDKEDDGQPDID